MTEPLDIYGTKEAVALLGISRQRFDIVRVTDERFPQPTPIRHADDGVAHVQLAATPVWDGPALRAYAAQRRGS